MIIIILVILALYPIVLVCYKAYVWYYNNRIYPRKYHKWCNNVPGTAAAGKRPELIDDKNILGPATTIWALILMMLGAGIAI